MLRGNRIDPYMVRWKEQEVEVDCRQKKTWLDNIKEDLEEEELDMRNAMNIIRDREKWRRHVKASSSAKA